MIRIAYSLLEIQRAIGGEIIGDRSVSNDSGAVLAFDSRKIHRPGSTLFIALKDKRDGHRYVAEAFRKGVRQFWVSDASVVPEGAVALVVNDTLLALQALARHHRQQLKGKVIGLTGSNGKTVVKEWLGQVLGERFRVGRSPGSFNSQMGVALSILSQNVDEDLVFIEAGISKKGEMAVLAAMIQPDWGVMTHFGDAHAEGFASPEDKLVEKLQLFRGCEQVFVGSDDQMVLLALRAAGFPLRTTGKAEEADLGLKGVEGNALVLVEGGEEKRIEWNLKGIANRENILLVLLVARHLGMEWEEIQGQIKELFPVSMRMEMLTDNPEITILNDAYNADMASVQNAFSILQATQSQPRRIVILSDLDLRGSHRERPHREILDFALQLFGPENVLLIGPIFSSLVTDSAIRSYPDVDTFLGAFDYDRFRRSVVLLKGARRFELERIVPYLSRRVSATYLKINLNHLASNYRELRSRIAAPTRMMAMVKAMGYGAGDWEVAQLLEREGVDYLAVAYTTAGIQLRTRRIRVPIMVMNADPANLDQLYRYNLEPTIYSLDILRNYVRTGERLGREYFPVHLNVDTGMSRLGFSEEDLPALGKFLAEHPRTRVVSVMSHLAVADDPVQNAATQAQARRFLHFCDHLELPEGNPAPIRHLVNTAGVLRFPEYQFEMVRVGIGLYGVSPVETPPEDLFLLEVASLHSVVTQVHAYPAGVAIGYGGTDVTQRPSRVATVAIGYADGVRRDLSNGKMSLLVRGQRAPIVGRVCMDMLMLDVTEVPGVQAGDEVVIIGQQGTEMISVNEMAEASGTIAYEILVNIGQRVLRVYEQD